MLLDRIIHSNGEKQLRHIKRFSYIIIAGKDNC